MNETTIIKSEKSRALLTIVIIAACMILVAIILRVAFPRYWISYSYYSQSNPEKQPFMYSLFVPRESMDWVISPLLYLGIVLLIAGTIMIVAYKSVSLTVTDKRVFGTAAWSKRVDLPFDMISAVSTSAFGGIAVSSSSGKISFKGIKNNSEIHSEISKLLLARQGKRAENDNTAAVQTSGSSELVKLHELLEKGIITQEEFDAKKKQILGL